MPDTKPIAANPKPVRAPATAFAIFGHHWNVDMMKAFAVLPSRHSPYAMALDCMPIIVPFMKFIPKYAPQMHTMNAISPEAPTK